VTHLRKSRLVLSKKGKVKKHHSNGWIFSCFAAYRLEQDLFWPYRLGSHHTSEVLASGMGRVYKFERRAANSSVRSVVANLASSNCR